MGNGIVTDRNQLPSIAKGLVKIKELSPCEMVIFQNLCSDAVAAGSTLSNDAIIDQIYNQIVLERKTNRSLFSNSPTNDNSPKCTVSKRRSDSVPQADISCIGIKDKTNSCRTKSFDSESRQTRGLRLDVLTNISRSLQNFSISCLNIESHVEEKELHRDERDEILEYTLGLGNSSPKKKSVSPSTTICESMTDTSCCGAVKSKCDRHEQLKIMTSSSAEVPSSSTGSRKLSTITTISQTSRDPKENSHVPLYRTSSNTTNDENNNSISSNSSSFVKRISSISRARRPILGDNPCTWKSSIKLNELKEMAKQLHFHFSSSLCTEDRQFKGVDNPHFWCERDKFVWTDIEERKFIKIFVNGIMGPSSVPVGRVIEIVITDVLGDVLQTFYLPLTTVHCLLVDHHQHQATISDSVDNNSSGSSNVVVSVMVAPELATCYHDNDDDVALLTDHFKAMITNFCCDNIQICKDGKRSWYEIFSL